MNSIFSNKSSLTKVQTSESKIHKKALQMQTFFEKFESELKCGLTRGTCTWFKGFKETLKYLLCINNFVNKDSLYKLLG